jgi:hypothetical protein
MRMATVDDTAIMGLDMIVVTPCGHRIRDSYRYCGCTVARVSPYSRVSKILVWRCPWCHSRRGRVDTGEAKKLKAFIAKYGWNMRALAIGEVAHV